MAITPFIADHPLIQHKLTLLRDKNTGSKEFRELISRDRHAASAMRPPVTSPSRKWRSKLPWLSPRLR